MHRKFITLIVASAMAVTGLSAAPARADVEDAAKVIVGVAALAILGAAIADAKDDKDRVTRNRGHLRHDDRHRGNRHKWDNRHRGNKHARPLPKRVQRKLLPGVCRIDVRARNGQRLSGFGRRCLKRNYGYANSLPRACESRVRGRHGHLRTMYRGRCLHRHGYREANARW
jgi:Ni/Co efflux regulator RcnB